MTTVKKIFNYIGGVLLSFILYFLGGFDVAITTLTVFIIVDVVTGLLKAIVEKNLSSKVMWTGILKQVCTYLRVGLAHISSIYTGIEGLRLLTVSFYIADEALSILENVGKIGVPIPKKLKDDLDQLRQDNDSDCSDDNNTDVKEWYNE